MKTLFNSFKRIALLGLIVIAATFTAAAGNIVITLKDGRVLTYSTSQYDVVYVGAEYGQPGAIGVKIYPKGNTTSYDYLFSQMSSYEVEISDVATPVISPADGTTFSGSLTVTITCPTSGATIYYTTNGSNPSNASTQYSGAFTVNATTTIKAIAFKNGDPSAIASATYTLAAVDDNTNRNSINSRFSSCNYSWRLEFPQLGSQSGNVWSKCESDGEITYALEWDKSLISSRWVAYQMYDNNWQGNAGRNESWHEDTNIPENYRSKASDYSGSGYSRGHMCPSADRQKSKAQNQQTFSYSNMQPQLSNHNSGIWEKYEIKVRKWADLCDTLYVVKAGTIGTVTINGSTNTGVYSSKCNNRLPVPSYFYMALLAYDKTNNQYHAVGIWTEHNNTSWSNLSDKNLRHYAITINELEARTGIDFFCNLPDTIENTVEATIDDNFWTWTVESE